MGTLVLSGATSGATTITPTDAVTATLTLPSSTGTILTTANPQSGGVIQVVNSTLSISTSTTSTSFVTSGLSATITPKFSTSKILVMVSGGKTYNSGGGNLMYCNLYKNGSTLGTSVGWSPCSDANPMGANQSFIYLDSPATTSATTYTPYYKSGTGGSVYFLDTGGAFIVTMTLMEIAA